MDDAFAVGGPISLGKIYAEIRNFRNENGHLPEFIELTEAGYETLKMYSFAGSIQPTHIFGVPFKVKKDV